MLISIKINFMRIAQTCQGDTLANLDQEGPNVKKQQKYVMQTQLHGTSCAWWYIAACTTTHHLTWRTWSRRRLLQLLDLVSDLLHPIQLQCHELHRRSETGPLRRLAHVHGTNFHHCFVASILLLLSNVNLRHVYIITLLIDIVRRPCCVSALTSP